MNKQEVETIMSFAAMQARNFALVSPMTSEQAEEEAVRQAELFPRGHHAETVPWV